MSPQELFEAGKYAKVISKLKGTPSQLLAYAYQKNKQWEEAMNVWNSLIVAQPNNASFYNDRGVCKFNLRFKHAIQDFNKAIELEPENAYYYSCRAYIKDKTGDTEGSVEDYQKALDLDPEDAITLNNLGLAEQKLGFTARARERFKYSDDLLGIKTIDSRGDITDKEAGDTVNKLDVSAKSIVWQEFKKMWTKDGFLSFWKELMKR